MWESSSGLILRECDKNPKQQFVFEDDGKIKPVNDLGLCLTASGDYRLVWRWLHTCSHCS